MLARWESLLPALAAAALVLVSSAHWPVGRLLHYATLHLTDSPGRASLLSLVALGAALLHERLVRGALYGALRRRLAAGLAAPTVAVIGAFVPVAARLTLFPRERVPIAIVVLQAFLVEGLLGLGLAWLALGSGSTLPGGVALGLVFALRLFVDAVFHGGVLPLLEVLAAGLAAISVAGILTRSLERHRAAVMEA